MVIKMKGTKMLVKVPPIDLIVSVTVSWRLI